MKRFPKTLSALLLSLIASAALADATLLNASYDVARDVYKDYNPVFQKYWKQKTGRSGRPGSGRGNHESGKRRRVSR